jgi:hypothetical protein
MSWWAPGTPSGAADGRLRSTTMVESNFLGLVCVCTPCEVLVELVIYDVCAALAQLSQKLNFRYLNLTPVIFMPACIMVV